MLRTILIVDDSSLNRKILRNILGSVYNVLEADNGLDALAVLAEHGESVSAVILDLLMPELDGYQTITRMRADKRLASIPVIVATGSTETNAEVRALALGANDFITKPYNPEIIKHRLGNTINLRETASIINAIQRDPLTGLYNRETFFSKAEKMIKEREPGYYVMACFDVDNFKFINDQYGNAKGDEILIYLGNLFREGFDEIGGICSRVTDDNFAVLYPSSFIHSPQLTEIRRKAELLDGTVRPISFGIGRYLVTDLTLSGSAMYDRAVIAEAAVRARFDVRIAQYDESMRESILAEQEIISEMSGALASGQFEIWLQPQYNHSSGALIGAEALVRWRHPKKGLISPAVFIPVFERNGFIYEMDKFVWEQACKVIRDELDSGCDPLPISVNVSRYDIFREDLFDVVTGLLSKYNISKHLLRLEITESAFAKSAEQIIRVVKRLAEYGFTIEIDDFGSGYSSLNTLKDVPADILKLDMRFLGDKNSVRGGNILESVVRMAKWLGMPVIAEGVETREQADYLRSIGCFYVQGYLYARPMPTEDYLRRAANASSEHKMASLETIDKLDNNAFWNPNSMETLIFNSYVGGACIFEYHNGNIELLRVNEKYAQELSGQDMPLETALSMDLSEYLDGRDRDIMRENIIAAIEKGVECVCELCVRNLYINRPRAFIRAAVRCIARADDRALLYSSITNVTAQRLAEQKEREVSMQLQAIINNINGGVSAATLIDGVVTNIFVSDSYFKMYGYTRDQFEAELERGIVDLIHPDDLDNVFRTAAECETTGIPFKLEYRVRKRDGEYIWVRSNGSICQMDGYDAPVQIAVTNDITSERQSQEQIMQSSKQLSFLNETAHALLAHADVNEGVEDVLRRVLEYFDGDRAYVLELDPVLNVANNTYEVCAPGVTSEIEFVQNIPISSIPFWARAVETDNCVSIEDVDALDDSRAIERGLLQAQGIRSLVAVPFYRGGDVVGFIGVDDPRRQSDVDHLKAIGDYIAVMLMRRELNKAIESDRQSLAELMNDTPGGFVRMRVYDTGAIIPVYVNAGFLSLVGMTREEFKSNYRESAMWGVHPSDLHIVNGAVEKMLATGETYSQPYRLLNGRGEYIWLMFFGRRTQNEAGEVYLNIYYTDMSEQQSKARAAMESEQIFRLAAAHSNRLLYKYDLHTRTAWAVDANAAQRNAVVMSADMPESVINSGYILPESVQDFRFLFDEIHEGVPEGARKIHLLDIEGVARWIDMRYSLLNAAEGAPRLAVISLLDITRAHERELAYDRYLQTINLSSSTEGKLAYFEVDITANIVEKQGGMLLPPGFPDKPAERDEMVEFIASAFIARDEREKFREYFSRGHMITAFADGARNLSEEWTIAFRSGELGFMRTETQLVQDPYSGHIKAYSLVRDISHQKRAALKIKKQAEIDGMTGLYNKTTTEIMVKKRLARADGLTCALMIADLDDLKAINDNLGHNCGDEAIRLAADALRAQFRRTDIVGRVGGDEFMVFIDGGVNENTVKGALKDVMNKLANARVGENGEAIPGISVGVALGVSGTDAFETLYQKADKALYQVKRGGKRDYALYAPDMNQ